MQIETMTRKQQVLERLRSSLGHWVDGPDLSSERVGGDEGRRRVRELKAEGYAIVKRRQPNGRRGIWQYSLTKYSKGDTVESGPHVDVPAWKRQWTCETCGNEPVDRPQPLPGGLGLARCGTCSSRRYFRQRVAVGSR